MTFTDNTYSPVGLHGRAVAVALDLLDRMHSTTPAIADVAEAMDIPEDRLRPLFDTDEAILIAAVERALIVLIDNCTKAAVRADPQDPVAQFTEIADAYLHWASDHRAEFRLMSDQRLLTLLKAPRLRRYLDSLADLTRRLLLRAEANGQLHPREDIDMMVLSARCFTYGMARMIVDGRLPEWVPQGGDPVDVAKILTRDFIHRMARSSQPQPV